MRILGKFIGFCYLTFLSVSCRGLKETISYVEVNGQRLLYSVRGPEGGKPVVLMHGNGGSHKSMAVPQMILAKGGYRVYCPDSRGQGANEPLNEYHYADMAEDCYQFIKALRLGKPAVGGWSDGGINTLLLEMAHPGTCAMMAVAGANLTPDCGEGFEEFKAWILEQNTPLTQMMLNEPNIDPKELAVIKCPTLVTVGGRDLISVEHTKLISDNIPDAELVVFEKASHSSYIKRNPRFGKCLLEFLSRHGY